jgi:hypothetical protein
MNSFIVGKGKTTDILQLRYSYQKIYNGNNEQNAHFYPHIWNIMDIIAPYIRIEHLFQDLRINLLIFFIIFSIIDALKSG